MIIGVDESGDFRAGSRGLFVGVFIRPSERDDLIAAYRRWERSVRRALGLTNELKGFAVPDEWASVLLRDVLTDRSRTAVRYLAFAVDVSSANLDAMEVQRSAFIDGYEKWANNLASSDDPARVSASRHITRLADWIGARPPAHLLKLVTLGTILTTLIEYALPRAILGGFDEELEHLQILIDRGYVKHDDLDAWREVLRNAIINESHDHPLAILDTWTDAHPFMQKFVETFENGATVLKPAFREMTNFYDSEATPEIRIADVVASLIFRCEILGQDLASYRSLRNLSLDTHPYRLIVWTKRRRQPIADPYSSRG